MVTTSGKFLTPTLLNQLTAIKRTQRAVDETQLRLATGLAVNSALDNPQNFFTAQSLTFRSQDLSKLLDGIALSTRTVEEALSGVTALERLIDQAETAALSTKEELKEGIVYPNLTFVEEIEVSRVPPTLQTQILADGPDAYYRLDDVGGVAAESSGNPLTFDGNFNGGASSGGAPLYGNGGGTSAVFNGGNNRVRIPDSTLINTASTDNRTVELVFNADTTAGRQVLYEEGATVNGLTIYIDAGRLYVTAEDDAGGNRYANVNISEPIVAGQTYHVAFVYERGAEFTGYLDGEVMGTPFSVPNEPFPSHSGDVGIGGVSGGVQFHDGEDGTANGYNFDGRIADVAIYNRALDQTELASHANSLEGSTILEYENTEYNKIIDQITQITQDANFRGVNLLGGENLTTYFNEDGSNFIETEGEDFTVEGLGLENNNFNDINDVDRIINQVRDARERVRRFGSSLVTDLSVIETRQDFTRGTINNLKNGADDLTIADQNEEGANLLALQVRQGIQFANLALRPASIADFLL